MTNCSVDRFIKRSDVTGGRVLGDRGAMWDTLVGFYVEDFQVHFMFRNE